jgi:hypothetical protein
VPPSSAVKGGTKLGRYLDKTLDGIENAGTLRVGFLEGATYPPKLNVADDLLKGLDKLNRVGPFAKRAKAPAVGPAALTKAGPPSRLRQYRQNKKSFVGPRQEITIPVATVAYWNNFGTKRSKPRPFFTNMVAKDSPNWGKILAGMMEKGIAPKLALAKLGDHVIDQLVKAIVDWPADNAPLTVAIKGFNKGLVDRGIMQRNVGKELK